MIRTLRSLLMQMNNLNTAPYTQWDVMVCAVANYSNDSESLSGNNQHSVI